MRGVTALGCLAVLGIVTYANSLNNNFLLDDYGFFSQFKTQPSLIEHFIPERNRQLGIDSPQTDRTYYRPLAHVIPHVCFKAFSDRPLGYHIVNLSLFILAAWLTFLVLRFILTPMVAWFAAVLFLIHPINAVVVNYVTASVYAAQMIFMMGSLLCLFWDSRKAQLKDGEVKTMGDLTQTSPPANPTDWRAGHVLRLTSNVGSAVFYILAILCHETAMVTPVYAALLWFALNAATFRNWKSSTVRLLRETAGLWIVLFAYVIFRIFFVSFSRSLFYSQTLLDLTIFEKFASILKVLGWYWSRIFVPIDIFLMWSQPFVKGNPWGVITIGVSMALLFAIFIWKKGKIPAAIFMGWFIVGAAPLALGVFCTPYMGALIEPHWLIAASIAIFVWFAILWERIPQANIRRLIGGLTIVLLVAAAWKNNHLWGDEIKLYERWAVVNPNFKAVHYFLGTTYHRQREYEKAREHLRQSLLGRYKDWIVYLALAQIDLKQGRLDSSQENIEKAYALEPRNSDILNVVGAVHFRRGNLEKAAAVFTRAIEANRFNIEPRMNLASLRIRQKDFKAAKIIYQDVLVMAPDFLPAQKGLLRLQQNQ